MSVFLNWWNGWRWDNGNNWLVRARRYSDPPSSTLGPMGFVEESCIAVCDHATARAVDRRDRPYHIDYSELAT